MRLGGPSDAGAICQGAIRRPRANSRARRRTDAPRHTVLPRRRLSASLLLAFTSTVVAAARRPRNHRKLEGHNGMMREAGHLRPI